MKKLLSIMLAVILILTVVPMGAFTFTTSAATSGTTGECSWTIDGTTLIISGNGKMEDYNSFMSTPWYYNILYSGIVITNVIVEDGVKNIGSNSFSECYYLEKVTISASVETIGARAFGNCHNLTVITIAEKNNNLCLLDNVVYDKGITTLILYPATKNDTTYEIPNTVTKIQESAFHNCDSLKSVTIGGNVSTIEGNVFSGCDMLQSIIVSNDNVHYYSNDGVLFSCDDAALLLYPSQKIDTKYTVPVGVKKIASGAFGSCNNIQNLEISEGASIIDDYAITWCENLFSVNIPSSVTKIGLGVFDGCYNISDVYISDLVAWCAIDNMSSFLQYTERLVLNGDVITDLVIPEGVISIGENTFTCYGALESVVLPDGITCIGRHAFGDCDSLKNIVIPNSVVSIDEYAFFCMNGSSLADVWYTGSQSDREGITIGSANAPLESATWHYDTCKTGKHIYADNNDTTCENCEWVRTIVESHEYTDGYYTYTINNNEATIIDVDKSINGDVIIPSTLGGYPVTTIGEGAFFEHFNITGVTIPASVTSIVQNSLSNNSFTYINVSEKNKNYCSIDGVLFNKNATLLIQYPSESDEMYTTPDSVTAIGSSAFANTIIKSIILSSNVISIGDYAFFGCGYLESITLSNGIRTIGNMTFMWCKNIKEIIIPDSVTYIGNGAFAHCWGLEKVTIGSEIESIGDSAFWGCGSLTNITIPNNVNSIGENAFGECENIIICGYKDSYAQTYAKDNNINFSMLQKITSENVTIVAPETVIDSSAELKVEEVENGNFAVTLPEGYSMENANVYDIYFEKDGETVQPNGELTVKIAVPADKNGENCAVYHIAEDGTLTDMNAVFKDGYMVFTTNHFSYYALVEQQDDIVPGDANGDGKINGKDYALLLQSINGWDVTINSAAADVNGDGKLNGKDYALLLQSINGWDVELQ
ncbi:MAG: leucine-rich repeat protein [Clostridia bacterium]|nr:leucine-rich repeat protein [Clostridia bacterium]